MHVWLSILYLVYLVMEKALYKLNSAIKNKNVYCFQAICMKVSKRALKTISQLTLTHCYTIHLHSLPLSSSLPLPNITWRQSTLGSVVHLSYQWEVFLHQGLRFSSVLSKEDEERKSFIYHLETERNTLTPRTVDRHHAKDQILKISIMIMEYISREWIETKRLTKWQPRTIGE